MQRKVEIEEHIIAQGMHYRIGRQQYAPSDK